MSDYPYEPTPAAAAEPEPDPRVVALHRVVDLERQWEQAKREADRRAKQAAIIGEELRQARDDLSGLLGYPSNSGKVQAKAMAEELAFHSRTAR